MFCAYQGAKRASIGCLRYPRMVCQMDGNSPAEMFYRHQAHLVQHVQEGIGVFGVCRGLRITVPAWQGQNLSAGKHFVNLISRISMTTLSRALCDVSCN